MSKLGKWSTTASSNNAATPDGWPENQLPSTVNDCAREMMASIKTYASDAEWFDRDMTPTFVNANSFTVTGDQTGILEVGRKLKLYTGSTVYRFVAAASFTAVTTVSLGAGTAITSSLSSFAIATLSQTNPSLPQRINADFALIDVISTSAVSCTGSIYAAVQMRAGNGNQAAPSYFMDATDTDTGMYWVSDGLIGWTSNSNIGGKLSAGGFIAPAFTISSDERLKKDWSAMPSDFVGRLAQVLSGTFTHIENPAIRKVGVGAQSLQQLLPEAVVQSRTDGYLAVSYGNAALVAAVELAKEVVALRKEVEALKEMAHTHHTSKR